jgi:hypothetical protein
MRNSIGIVAALLVPTTSSWAQNCVISGGVNNGTITQNCTVIGRTKLAFESPVAEELASKLPAGKPVRLMSVGSGSDQRVAGQYQQFLQSRGFSVERTIIGMLAPPPDHPISIQVTDPATILVIAPSAY